MSAQHTTDAEIVAALRAVREHGGKVQAAKAIGVPESTIRRRLAQADKRGLHADTPVSTEVDQLKLALQRAKQDLKTVAKEALTAEAIRQEIYNLAARSPKPASWVVKDDGVGRRGMPVTIWSDWHYGEVVHPDEVGGLNEYNAEIAAARIESLVDKTIELCLHHMGRATEPYPGIVVCLGGDMISGDLHEELFATNDRTTQQCINELTDLLAGALERMADTFGRVFVPCVVGNHGRASRKPRMKGRVWTSHEWNIYCNLARYFRHDKRIQFLIPNESDAHFRVYNTRFLLTHGDSLGVKGGDGIIGAIGPITRGKVKVGQSESAVGRDVDYIIMGHWHQTLWLPGVIVNNCLKGYDEYARLAMRAPYAPPSQSLWFVHPKHGITAKWEVLVDKARSEKKSDWVTWKE